MLQTVTETAIEKPAGRARILGAEYLTADKRGKGASTVVNRDRGQTTPVNGQTAGEWLDQMNRLARESDEAAFAELFEHFAPRIKAFLMKSGTAPSMAEECAQDVMATVWRKAHMFDPDRASVATWIFTIARNRRIDLIRRDRRPDPEDLPWGPEAEPDQLDVLALQQESIKLGAALADLPINQRELIEKAYFGDMSHGEIAKITGLPLGTIKSRIRLALEKLRLSMT
jgi:RNA polymerase sigma factor (sigma-70 family)